MYTERDPRRTRGRSPVLAVVRKLRPLHIWRFVTPVVRSRLRRITRPGRRHRDSLGPPEFLHPAPGWGLCHPQPGAARWWARRQGDRAGRELRHGCGAGGGCPRGGAPGEWIAAQGGPARRSLPVASSSARWATAPSTAWCCTSRREAGALAPGSIATLRKPPFRRKNFWMASSPGRGR